MTKLLPFMKNLCFAFLSCIAAIAFGCTKNMELQPAETSHGRALTAGNIYYINNNGNDQNNGISPATPWKTIGKVNAFSFSPGDQILFAGGQTFTGNLVASSSGNSSAYIRYASYGTGKATISAGSGTGIYIYNKAFVWVDSLVVTGGWNETSQSGNAGRGIHFQVDTTAGAKLGNSQVTNCDIGYFKIAGIAFGSSTRDNTQCGYNKIIAAGNSVHNNGIAGITSDGPYIGGSAYAFDSASISCNTIFHNFGLKTSNGNHTGDGIVISDCAGGKIEYNTAYNNGWYNANNGGGPAAIWCWDSKNMLFQYNEAYNNGSGTNVDGDGFDLDGGAANCVMQYNYSHNNKGAGYLVWEFGDIRGSNSNNIIRYNISENDGSNPSYGAIHLGVGTGNITGNNIYNNTVYSTTCKAVVVEGGSNNNFVNNILYATSSYGILSSEGNAASAFFFNNDYWGGSQGIHFYVGSAVYTSLSAFRQSYNEILNDLHYGYTVDPQLNNPGNAGTIGVGKFSTLTNYQLQAGSPMIDAGFNLAGLWGYQVGKVDFNISNIPNGNGYDIGACESLLGGSAGIISGATYQLVSAVNNASVLDVNGGYTANGTIVQLWTNKGGNNQKWKATGIGGGYYTLQPQNAPLSLLDVNGSGTANGTQVQIWTSNGGNDQKWFITNVGNGYYTLAPANAPGSRLDVNGSATANGTKVQIWTSNGGNNQKWKFIKML